MTARWLVLMLAFSTTIAGAQAPQAARPAEGPRLRLRSGAFSDGAMIPLQFTCYAEGGKSV